MKMFLLFVCLSMASCDFIKGINREGEKVTTPQHYPTPPPKQ